MAQVEETRINYLLPIFFLPGIFENVFDNLKAGFYEETLKQQKAFGRTKRQVSFEMLK